MRTIKNYVRAALPILLGCQSYQRVQFGVLE